MGAILRVVTVGASWGLATTIAWPTFDRGMWMFTVVRHRPASSAPTAAQALHAVNRYRRAPTPAQCGPPGPGG
jgi:hypothetical protein